jgi:hypothetical protein
MCICGNPDCKIPYGLCHCECGGKTELARDTDRPKLRIAGSPTRFIFGHGARKQRPSRRAAQRSIYPLHPSGPRKGGYRGRRRLRMVEQVALGTQWKRE